MISIQKISCATRQKLDNLSIQTGHFARPYMSHLTSA